MDVTLLFHLSYSVLCTHYAHNQKCNEVRYPALQTSPLSQFDMSVVVFQDPRAARIWCLLKHHKVHIWMFNSQLMIKVSRCRELLSNNARLCLFIKTFGTHGSYIVGTGVKMCKTWRKHGPEFSYLEWGRTETCCDQTGRRSSSFNWTNLTS